MVKKLSCVSCGSLKRFSHTFTIEGQCGKVHIINKQASSFIRHLKIPKVINELMFWHSSQEFCYYIVHTWLFFVSVYSDSQILYQRL